MQIAKKAFFKNILVLGKENIPYGKPVLIASNHPSAFMDPIFVGLTMTQQIHFLARGDVFKTPFAKWALGQMNILPIFRKEDSDNNHEKNELTYHICAEKFKQNKFIVIYPEGYCVQEKKLRPLKKGASRLAFFTLEKYNWDLDLYILPTGVNYSNPNRFQSDLVINYGKAIRVSDYKEEFLQSKNKANSDLTKLLEERMKNLLVIIDKHSLEHLADGIEYLYKNEIQKKHKISYNNQKDIFELRKAIGRAINEAYKAESDFLNLVNKDVKHYFKKLEKMNLRDWLFENGNQKQFYLKEILLFILFSPLCGPAFLFNYYVFKYPHTIAKKKIKNIEFYPSVLIGSGAMIFALYYLVISLVISILLHNILLTPLVLIILIFLGFCTIHYHRLYKKLFGKIRFNTLLNKKNRILKNLITERSSIKVSIGKILEEHPLIME